MSNPQNRHLKLTIARRARSLISAHLSTYTVPPCVSQVKLAICRLSLFVGSSTRGTYAGADQILPAGTIRPTATDMSGFLPASAWLYVLQLAELIWILVWP